MEELANGDSLCQGTSEEQCYLNGKWHYVNYPNRVRPADPERDLNSEHLLSFHGRSKGKAASKHWIDDGVMSKLGPEPSMNDPIRELEKQMEMEWLISKVHTRRVPYLSRETVRDAVGAYLAGLTKSSVASNSIQVSELANRVGDYVANMWIKIKVVIGDETEERIVKADETVERLFTGYAQRMKIPVKDLELWRHGDSECFHANDVPFSKDLENDDVLECYRSAESQMRPIDKEQSEIRKKLLLKLGALSHVMRSQAAKEHAQLLLAGKLMSGRFDEFCQWKDRGFRAHQITPAMGPFWVDEDDEIIKILNHLEEICCRMGSASLYPTREDESLFPTLARAGLMPSITQDFIREVVFPETIMFCIENFFNASKALAHRIVYGGEDKEFLSLSLKDLKYDGLQLVEEQQLEGTDNETTMALPAASGPAKIVNPAGTALDCGDLSESSLVIFSNFRYPTMPQPTQQLAPDQPTDSDNFDTLNFDSKDFGKAVLMRGRNNESSTVVYECRNRPGFFFLFRKNKITQRKDGKQTINYRCNGCEAISRKGIVGTTTVREGRLVKDPMVGHNRHCVPVRKAKVEAMKISREMKAKCRQGTRPMQAYQSSMIDVIAHNHDSGNVAEIQDLIGPYHRNRRSLYKHTTKRFIPIPDFNRIPMEYQVTLETRLAMESGGCTESEKLLLYAGEKFLIFASNENLRALHQSEFWICDGTFQVCPKPFAQLYTLHGFVNGEGLPLCHALMPDRTASSYRKLFHELKTAIESNFGTVGILHTVLMDFEQAARQAVLEVFKYECVSVKGCLFHLGQCLDRALNKYKLKTLYINGGRHPEANDVPGQFYRWIRMLKAMSFLPPALVGNLWRNFMSRPAVIINRIANDEIAYRWREYIDYFEKTWMPHIDLWNHFHNEWRVCIRLHDCPGPRTTNHAEGWHNKINVEFGHPHPALNTFLDWLQRSHQIVDIRARQLFNNQPPKPRDVRYVNVDRQLRQAKNELLSMVPRDFSTIAVRDYWPEPIRRHLRRVAFLIGDVAVAKAGRSQTSLGNCG